MPIVESLLDTDQYKLTMGQMVRNYFPEIPVIYTLINRTKNVNLAEHINEQQFIQEVEHVRILRASQDEIDWLRATGLFSEEFLAFFCHIATPQWRSPQFLELPRLHVTQDNGEIVVEAEGSWPHAKLWEIPCLSIINELYFRSVAEEQGVSHRRLWREGERRLLEKIRVLKQHPEIKFVEFGTRRRFSRRWQKHALEMLLNEIPDQVLSTSNMLLAKEFGIDAGGTQAHAPFMVLYGYFRSRNDPTPVLSAHNEVLRIWWETYGEKLSVALTDTFGTDFFLENFTAKHARLWRGVRQDSGDPIAIGEKIVAFYQQHGIDPREKLLFFSDGLTLKKIIELFQHFSGRIQVAFGWGTNLTNDLGLVPLSLVMKATKACGIPTVKLSDNPAKATGPSDEIERVKKEVGYQDRPSQPIIY